MKSFLLLLILQRVTLHSSPTGPAAGPTWRVFLSPPRLLPLLQVHAGADVRHLVRGVGGRHLPAEVGEEAGHDVAGVGPQVGGPGGADLGRHPGDVDRRDPLGSGLHPLADSRQGQRPGRQRTARGGPAAVQLGVLTLTGGVQLRPDGQEPALRALGGPHCHDVGLKLNSRSARLQQQTELPEPDCRRTWTE